MLIDASLTNREFLIHRLPLDSFAVFMIVVFSIIQECVQDVENGDIYMGWTIIRKGLGSIR